MRISDWSSDVCSSDLDQQGEEHEEIEDREAEKLARRAVASAAISAAQHDAGQQDEAEPHRRGDGTVDDSSGAEHRRHDAERGEQQTVSHDLARSEEHTSELQSLMRNSYAVFCLKKKNKAKHTK